MLWEKYLIIEYELSLLIFDLFTCLFLLLISLLLKELERKNEYLVNRIYAFIFVYEYLLIWVYCINNIKLSNMNHWFKKENKT